MATIGPIKGSTPEETQKLREKEIETLDDLWTHLGKNFGETINQLSADTKIARQKLIKILMESGNFESITSEEAEKLFLQGVRNMDDLRRRVGITPYVSLQIQNLSLTPIRPLLRALLRRKFDRAINELSSLTGIESDRLIAILSNRFRIRRFILFDSSKFEGFELGEAEKMFGNGIRGLDDLWVNIGSDPNKGITDVATETNIDSKRIIDVLADQGKREAESSTGSWLSRRWLDVILTLAPLIMIALLIRAVGRLTFLPSPLSLRGNAVFAARNLEKGHVLRAGDFYTARATYHDNYFQNQRDLEGLIIDQAIVTHGKPIRHKDVLRLQVVAVKDILPGKPITADAVAAQWRQYEEDAIVEVEKVVGQQASHAIRNGDVIHSSFLTSKF